jgi:hypothetical protein
MDKQSNHKTYASLKYHTTNAITKYDREDLLSALGCLCHSGIRRLNPIPHGSRKDYHISALMILAIPNISTTVSTYQYMALPNISTYQHILGYRRTTLMTIPHTTVDFIQHLGVIIVASAVPSRMLLVATAISVFK